jgi:hypothetical protein
MLRGRGAGIAAVFAVVAAAALAAGCGGGGSALSLDPVAAAATKTQQAGAARIRLALTFSAPQLQGGRTLKVRGSGAVDGESSKLNLSVGSKSLEEISLEQNGDYVAYLRFAPLAGKLPGGKQWLELDLSKLGKSAGLDLESLLAGSQVQPGDLLSMLAAEGAKIQNLGSATVDGAATTHYRVTIDTAKALQAKGLTTPLVTGLAAQLPTIPADVWIGKDGLVHRAQVSLGVAQRRLGLTVDLYDYGADVDIAAPPSSDVFDATQFARHGMLGSGHWSPYSK